MKKVSLEENSCYVRSLEALNVHLVIKTKSILKMIEEKKRRRGRGRDVFEKELKVGGKGAFK